MTISRLIRQYAPSFRIGHDPLAAAAGVRFAPIPIQTMKLTLATRRQVLQQRRPLPFEVQEGQRLTIIIAYRNRAAHLAALLPPLQRHLQQDGIQARILVVEQAGQGLFNRGKLMNVGARHSAGDSDYYCFHDVDMIPELAEYRCPSQPLRLVTRLSCTHRGFSNMSGPYLGGTASMRRDQFERINGFSNRYWGWGQEDDDLLMRCLLAGLVPHEDREGLFADLDTPVEEMKVNLVVGKRGSNLALKRAMWRGLCDPGRDGLGNVDYQLLAEQDHGVYRQITVDINAPAVPTA